MRARLPRLRLVLAQDRAELGPLVALMLLVVVTSFLLAAVPRQLSAAESDALREALTRADPAQRELTATATNTAPAAQLAAIDEQLRADQAPVLAKRVTEAGLTETSNPFDLFTPDGRNVRPKPFSWALLAHQVGLLDHVRWVDGEAPDDSGPRTVRTAGYGELPLLETAILADMAKVLDLQVGRTYVVRPLSPQPNAVGPFAVRITGSFEREEPDDPRWDYLTQVWANGERYTPDGSLLAEVGAMLVDESQADRLRSVVGTMRYDWHYPVDTDGLSPTTVPALLAAVRSSVSNASSAEIPLVQDTFRPPTVVMGSGLDDLLEAHLEGSRAAASVVAIVVAGLGVVGLLVLTLASVVVVVRRAPVLALARARGASVVQVVLVVVAGVALGVVPAAVAGAVLARVLVDQGTGDVGTTDLVLVAAIGLWAIGSCAVATWWQTRAHRGGSVVRRAAEGALVVAAVAAAVLLRAQGPDEGAAREVDPLLAGAPVLVALALAVVLLRAAPLLVDALAASRRNSRGLVSFLGLARAARQPAVLSAPLAALLVALGFAIFATGAVRTVDTAQAVDTWRTVGADYQVQVTYVPPETLAAVKDLPGVQVVAPAYVRTDAGLEDAQGRTERATAMSVDAAAYARILAGAPAGTTDTDAAAVRDLARDPGGEGEPLPALLTTAADGLLEGQVELSGGLGATDVTRRTVTDRFPLANGLPLVLADLGALQARQSAPVRPNTLFVAGAPGLADDLEEIVARTELPHRVLDRRADLAEVRSSPFVGSTRDLFALMVPVAGGYAILATVLALVLAAPTRRRDTAVLRRLGASPRETLRLALTEQAPLVLGMLAGGVVAGLGLVWLTLGAVDLSPLTGGIGPPEISLPLMATTLLTGGLLVLVASATAVVSVAERRPDAGRDDGSER